MSNSIKILFFGDFCSSAPDEIELSGDLQGLIDSSNLNVINFEGVLQSGKVISPNKSFLKQSEFSPKWCEDNGFDIVSLANNHAYDFGREGLETTINTFSTAKVIGAGAWHDVYKVNIVEIKGKRLGFLALTSADMSSLKDKWTDKNKVGTAWINSNEVNKLIQSCKAECDFLFIFAHAGVEHMDVPLPEWRERYREMIDLGADGVIATHPHTPQGYETYKDKPIYYSLGNFFFDKSDQIIKKHNWKYWNTGLVANLEIDLNTNNISHTGIVTLKNGNKVAIDVSTETKEYINHLNSLLDNDIVYMDRVNEGVLFFYDKYKTWMLNSFKAFELKFNFKYIYVFSRMLFKKPNYKSALHQLREESTRWTIERALKIKSGADL